MNGAGRTRIIYNRRREDHNMKSCTPQKAAAWFSVEFGTRPSFAVFLVKSSLSSFIGLRAPSEIHPLSAVRHGSASGRTRRRSIEAESAAGAGAPKARAFYCAKLWRCSHAVPAHRLYYFQLQRHSGARLWFQHPLIIAHAVCYIIISANFPDPRTDGDLFVLRASRHGVRLFFFESTAFWNQFKNAWFKMHARR